MTTQSLSPLSGQVGGGSRVKGEMPANRDLHVEVGDRVTTGLAVLAQCLLSAEED